jgi:hypothetical protein
MATEVVVVCAGHEMQAAEDALSALYEPVEHWATLIPDQVYPAMARQSDTAVLLVALVLVKEGQTVQAAAPEPPPTA